MITNPPYKRKKIASSTSYLYIYETDDWSINDTLIFSYSPMCYSAAANNTYIMEDSTTIVVIGGKIVV